MTRQPRAASHSACLPSPAPTSTASPGGSPSSRDSTSAFGPADHCRRAAYRSSQSVARTAPVSVRGWSVSAVRLVPFTPELLPAVQPWFEHPEVRHRLGGPDWPVRELALRAAARDQESFRGKTVLRVHSFVALDDDEPVAHVGGDVYDRWAVW